MKSKITIEIDYENERKPCIKIIRNGSPDVRDNLISDFLQLLGHRSSWCHITYEGEYGMHEDRHQLWKLSPVEPRNLEAHAERMLIDAKNDVVNS